MQPQLRPLSLGEILDRTFQFYRKDFVLFVGIAALPQLIPLAMRITLSTLRGAGSFGVVIAAALGMMVVALVSLVVVAVSQAATSVAVSEMYLGRKTTIGAAYGRIRDRIGSMTGIVFGVGLLEGIGFMCLIIPGIYLALIWALAIPAAVIENLGFAECRDRSKALTDGAKGRMFMIYLLVLAVTYGVLFGLGVALAGAGGAIWGKQFAQSLVFQIADECVTFLGTTLVGPLGMIAFTIAYYDQRVRKEGFDIQFMMQGNQQQSAAAGGGAAV